MNRYCYVKDNVVAAVEDEFIAIFPDVPITKRYSKEFLDNCVVVGEDVEVFAGWIYSPETNTFSAPEIPEPSPAPEPGLEPPPLTEIELINQRLDTQDEVIEEILFDILPSLMGV